MELADRYEADVHALYCVETHRYGEPALSSTEIVLERLEEEGAAMLAELADRADNVGIDWTSTVCHGLPWEEIHEKADEVDADLIVLGYQGRATSAAARSGASPNGSFDTPIGRC